MIAAKLEHCLQECDNPPSHCTMMMMMMGVMLKDDEHDGEDDDDVDDSLDQTDIGCVTEIVLKDFDEDMD